MGVPAYDLKTLREVCGTFFSSVATPWFQRIHPQEGFQTGDGGCRIVSWCKVSSLSSAVVRATKDVEFPASKVKLLRATEGKLLEGWEVDYFLSRALQKSRYRSMREVMIDVEGWAERQG